MSHSAPQWPLPGSPPELVAALEARGARVTSATPDRPRTYVFADSPEGPLFAWYTSSATDDAVLAHEIAIRAAIGTTGRLRTPPILEHGPRWRVEPALTAVPLEGTEAVSRAVAAAQELAGLDLPQMGGPARAFHLGQRRSGRAALPFAALRRRALVARSPLGLNDVISARRIFDRSGLPMTTSHGDFHAGHIFFSDEEGAWVVDWDLVGPRPAGWDLLYLWTDLRAPEDRELVFDAAVESVGSSKRAELERLLYAAAVRMIAAKVADPNPRHRDLQGADVLLAQLPAMREKAKQRS